VQRKLAQKETNRKKTTLQKVSGFKTGLIFTSEEVMAVVAQDAEDAEQRRVDEGQKRELKELKDEAEKWLETAKEVQNNEHKRLVEEWKALPPSACRGRRQPGIPPLATMPERFREVLSKKAKKSNKPPKQKRQKAAHDSDSYKEDSD
jgi:hypothetical protein